jgi:hypothetical protein
MSTRVKEFLPQLRKVARLDKKRQKEFFSSCSKDFVLCICEVVRNLIKGRAPLRERHLKQLTPREQSLRKLAPKKTSLCERKKLLQRGGFAGLLIKPLLIALGLLASSLITNGNR